MKFFLTILFIFPLILQANAQQNEVDSLRTLELEPINRIIVDIPSDSAKTFKGEYLELENIASCIILLEVHQYDTLPKEPIFKRLEEFASYFVRKNEPIIILSTGMDSVEGARELNSKSDNGIRYISLGNSCLSDSKYVAIGIERFNQATKKQMGLNNRQ